MPHDGAHGLDDIAVGAGASGRLFGGNGDDLLVAQALSWQADIAPLNGSGVSGSATFTLDGDSLRVQVEATGLEPGTHLMHIHGRTDAQGGPLDSDPAGTARDLDGDGYVELGEGVPLYGQALLPLTSPPGGAPGDFPSVQGDTLVFDETYDLAEIGGADLDAGNLFPLTMRVIEIHGLTVAAGEGQGTSGEVNGTGGFKPLLPVAQGEITEPDVQTLVVPDPVALSGGNGADVLVGGRGNDVLVGGNGNDVLAGNDGNDILFGGNGADRFVIDGGQDVVRDFRASQGDRIVFADGSSGDDVEVQENGQGVQLTALDGASVMVMGLDADQVTDQLFLA